MVASRVTPWRFPDVTAGLQARLATAAVLTPLALLAVLMLPSVYFALLLGAVAVLAALEWAVLCGVRDRRARAAYALACVVFGAALLAGSRHLHWLLAVGVGWWLWAALEIRAWRAPESSAPGAPWLLRGLVAIAPAWCAVVYLHVSPAIGPQLVVTLFALVWLADSTAYLVGRRFGVRKLAPSLSPGKTIEGLIGGMTAVAAVGLVSGILLGQRTGVGLTGWVVLCLIAGLFSVLGDLTESALKRRARVKDSGSLLPGHGGVLDRIDSLLAAAPVLAFGWALLLRAAPASGG